jgi:short-subunit dehydrogenase involved in D-alanine esterification of teichoic acids
MASKISKLTLLLKKKRMNEIGQELARMKQELSTTVTICGAKSKVIGLVMHVSKFKRLSVTTVNKGVGDKRSRRELAYHRLVFCR